jgi:isoquinoline 1-oxidoreductase subunit alpha
MELNVNGQARPIQSDPTTPLLWVLRDELNLVGTKFGCGVMACGACTVHVDGVALRTCMTPAAALEGKHITTIEGLSADRSHALQKAWIKHQVPQCGYCQSGFLMAGSALLARTPKPTPEQINEALTNLCRCGTYDAMRAALQEVVEATP